MSKRIATAVVAALGAAAVAVPATAAVPSFTPHGAPAHVAHSTVSKGGITVTLPSRVVTYNKHRYRVVPKVRLARGAQKNLRRATVVAFAGRRRVAAGHAVMLPIGSYTARVTVPYRAYRYVIRHKLVVRHKWVTRYKWVTKTVTTIHPGGSPDGTVCTITAVLSSADDGVDDTIDTASCTNPAYPDQDISATGADLTDVPQGDDTTVYTVGQQVDTNGTVPFSEYTTSKQVRHRVAHRVWVAYKKRVAYRVKSWHNGRYVTPTRNLVVRDGGYVRFFTGHDADPKVFHFVTSDDSQWLYSISCGDYGFFGVNFNSSDYQVIGSFGPEDATDLNRTAYAVHMHGGGRFEFDVFAYDCTWAIGVFSDKRVG